MKKKKTLRDIMAANNKNKKTQGVIIACGCAPSVMDGTEHILNIEEKLDLPESFSYESNMPPVRNQGNSTTCVC